MAKLERWRDFLTAAPAEGYFKEKANEGWRLVAVEWERGATSTEEPIEDIPYGLRVASDCRRLEGNPDEMQVLLLLLEVIVQDRPLSKAAEVLNDRGHRTRDGGKWTPSVLFDLLPRLIEVGPRLSKSEEWTKQRKQILQPRSAKGDSRSS